MIEIVFAGIPAVALVLAAFVALVWPAGPRLRSAIMHLAAGVVFAVVAIELLPPIIHSADTVVVVVGFALGAGLMLGIKGLVGEGDEEGEGESKAPVDNSESGSSAAFLIAIGVDLFIDGVMLGLGFAAGERAGALLAIALTLEAISLGLATTTTLRKRGLASGRAAVTMLLLAATIALGAVAGTFVLRWSPAWTVPGILSFGAAALLFLVTEELLEEAHTVKESPALTAMFFAGFLFLMIVETIGAAH